MALQASASAGDPLKFSEIKTEFAGSANNLRAYLKGAGIVDGDDTAPNVPSSGTISILDFLGAARVTYSINITNQSAQNLSKSGIGGTATATYRLSNNGAAYRTNISGTLVSISGEWLVSGTASDFDVYVTWSAQGGGDGYIGGGSIGGDTPATWLNLGTLREFTLSATNNYVNRGLTVQIRYSPTGTVVDTATIDFEVDSAP
jgi:hypothetical protein